jgi:predicted Zn finger-like uncharacterized protein
MKVQCGQCPAKYAVADERLRGKKVRIRCRRCNAAIVVDGRSDPPLVTSTPTRQSLRPTSSVPAPESVPLSSPDSELPSPRPVAHTILGGLEAPIEAERYIVEQMAQGHAEPERDATNGAAMDLRPGMPSPARGQTDPPLGSNSQRWRVALTQQDLRWMTTEEITQAFRDGAVKLETFVFRTGMPTWLTLLEVDEIASALTAARLVALAPGALEPTTEERETSPPSRRISSLPPPRKAARNAAPVPSAPATPEPLLDSDRAAPFALVSGRGSSSKQDGDTSELGSESLAQRSELGTGPESSGRPEPPAAGATADLPAAALPPDLTPNVESIMGASAAHAEVAVRELSFERSTSPADGTEGASDPSGGAMSGGLAEPPKGTHLWVWLLLALIFVAAAALLLGPHFGLRLH